MFRRLKFVGLALVVVCASAVALASSASAFPLPSILPNQVGKEWTGKNVGNAELNSLKGFATVVCEAAKGTGTVTSNTLGAFHITFEKCSAAGQACTGLGDSSGTILSLGIYHTVVDVNSPELHASILFLPEETHFTCSILLQNVKSGSTNGGVNCLLVEPLKEAKSHEFQCKGKEGHQEEQKYFNDKGEEVTAVLEASTNHGTFESGAEIAKGTVEFAAAVKIDD